ncbi:nucleotidyltransferase domain-containing protein [Candidatus Bathyarchaeota archaeon]|nr:nucleotidyltransferase domain-containing protein [Candidatus Bathyarchaeota archaeon]
MIKFNEEYYSLLKAYTSILLSLFNEKLYSICLFGSLARGEAKLESDIDLLIVIKGLPKDIWLRYKKGYKAKKKLKEAEVYKNLKKTGKPYLISEVYLTPEEVENHPPILLDLIEDGIIIYDKKNFLKTVLNEIKKKLKELGAKRVSTSKGKYWILKPDLKLGEEIKI